MISNNCAKKDSPGFTCHCGGLMSVRRTLKLTQRIARERKCDECGDIESTVEMRGAEALRHELKAFAGELAASIIWPAKTPH